MHKNSEAGRLRIRWFRTLFISLVATAGVGAEPTMALRNVKVGDKAPSFTLKGLDDSTITDRDYAGKVLLLLFARPEQDRSVQALQIAQRILRDHDQTNLAVLAVSTKKDKAAYFKRVVAEKGLTFPIALDPGRKMYGTYGLIVSPTTLLIDESGVLRFELPHMPPNYGRRLQLHVDLMLGRISPAEHKLLLEAKSGAGFGAEAPVKRRLMLGRMLIEKEKYAEALPALTGIEKGKLGDQKLEWAGLVALAYLGIGKVDKAAEQIDELAAVKPHPLVLCLALARLESARNHADLAERYLLDCLETTPASPKLLFELGRLYEKRGDLTKAVDCYRRALEHGCLAPR